MPAVGTGERASRVWRQLRPFVSAQKKLGRRLRAYRDHHGWTLEETAERADLDLKFLQKLEAGGVNTTLVTLYRLAHAFGVEMKDLLDFAAELPAASKKRPRKRVNRVVSSRQTKK